MRTAKELQEERKGWPRRFAVGDKVKAVLVNAGRDVDGILTVVELSGDDGGFAVRLAKPDGSLVHARRYEWAFDLVEIPATEAGAIEYEEVMQAQDILNGT